MKTLNLYVLSLQENYIDIDRPFKFSQEFLISPSEDQIGYAVLHLT